MNQSPQFTLLKSVRRNPIFTPSNLHEPSYMVSTKYIILITHLFLLSQFRVIIFLSSLVLSTYLHWNNIEAICSRNAPAPHTTYTSVILNFFLESYFQTINNTTIVISTLKLISNLARTHKSVSHIALHMRGLQTMVEIPIEQIPTENMKKEMVKVENGLLEMCKVEKNFYK